MSKSYIAKYQGKVVGKRTTKDRTYTHAVVICPDVEYHRQTAYARTPNETDKSNYRYYLAIAEGRSQFTHSQDEVVAASVKVDGGFDAYFERVKARETERFEADLAKGQFEPGVATWCGRSDLALKAAAQYRHPSNKVVEIVQAELVAPKPPKGGGGLTFHSVGKAPKATRKQMGLS